LVQRIVRTRLAEQFGEEAIGANEGTEGRTEELTERVDRVCASINEKVNE